MSCVNEHSSCGDEPSGSGDHSGDWDDHIMCPEGTVCQILETIRNIVFMLNAKFPCEHLFYTMYVFFVLYHVNALCLLALYSLFGVDLIELLINMNLWPKERQSSDTGHHWYYFTHNIFKHHKCCIPPICYEQILLCHSFVTQTIIWEKWLFFNEINDLPF